MQFWNFAQTFDKIVKYTIYHILQLRPLIPGAIIYCNLKLKWGKKCNSETFPITLWRWNINFQRTRMVVANKYVNKTNWNVRKWIRTRLFKNSTRRNEMKQKNKSWNRTREQKKETEEAD